MMLKVISVFLLLLTGVPELASLVRTTQTLSGRV